MVINLVYVIINVHIVHNVNTFIGLRCFDGTRDKDLTKEGEQEVASRPVTVKVSVLKQDKDIYSSPMGTWVFNELHLKMPSHIIFKTISRIDII